MSGERVFKVERFSFNDRVRTGIVFYGRALGFIPLKTIFVAFTSDHIIYKYRDGSIAIPWDRVNSSHVVQVGARPYLELDLHLGSEIHRSSTARDTNGPLWSGSKQAGLHTGFGVALTPFSAGPERMLRLWDTLFKNSEKRASLDAPGSLLL